MKLSKKLFLIAATVLFCASSLCADITIKIGTPEPKPAPAKPAPAKPAPAPAKPRRTEIIEGYVNVRGSKIYLDTGRDRFLLIIDYDNPRIDRRDFERWDDMMIEIEGYVDYHYDEIEVLRVLKTPKDYLRHAKPAPARPAPAKPAPAKPAPAKPAPAKPAPAKPAR